MRKHALTTLASAVVGAGLLLATPARAADYPDFTSDFMADQANIDNGGVLWADQCRHCHGRNAYPGKAPKLKPRRYEADFLYARIAYGFRRMPAWEGVYTQDEIMDIVAYIMSDEFSP
jgi:mono/diheme cytochrome c family protein